MANSFQSWGRFPKVDQEILSTQWHSDEFPYSNNLVLPRGCGRSYGDSCLNDKNSLIDASSMDRFISFDPDSGVLHCDSGVTLNQIIDTFAARGWFPPVVPGTKYVTVAGAIANDVHGKNHPTAGTFANHVQAIRLQRSDGRSEVLGNPSSELFRATVGGLGLTGLIRDCHIQLKPIPGALMQTRSIPFVGVDDFIEKSVQARGEFEYVAAWIDCHGTGKNLGRGIISTGNHVSGNPQRRGPLKLGVPFLFPEFVLNSLTMRGFNTVVYNKGRLARGTHTRSIDSVLFPLDHVSNWNRIYGERGFLQYQCVIPFSSSAAISDLLKLISSSGQASFLAVLKDFGAIPAHGHLSFPREGLTLALDFPHRGESTLRLLESLDEIVVQSNGAVYPAKDARMSRASFASYYPNSHIVEKHRDPKISSSFWRRVTEYSE